MSSNYDAAIEAAIDRDIRDLERLDHFKAVITDAMDAVMHDIYPLEHPFARWHPDDLMEVLQGQLQNVEWERQRHTCQVVVEAECS